jgi:hypothetical protein
MAFLVIVWSLGDDRCQHTGVVLHPRLPWNRAATQERVLCCIRVFIYIEELVVAWQLRTASHHLLRKLSLPVGCELSDSRGALILIISGRISLVMKHERSMLQIEVFSEPRFLPLCVVSCGRTQERIVLLARRVDASERYPNCEDCDYGICRISGG